MPLPIVIIHGWSDQASSFNSLAQALAAKYNVQVSTINMAQWESMNDQITYDDLVTTMDAAWNQANLPRAPHSVDVIVHSTGGLLIRDWLLRYFALSGMPQMGGPLPDPALAGNLGQGRVPPVKHLVMLAPANFGSPLASKGTTFIGRVVKGWNSGEFFQVGALLLKGLELASTYTWKLAQWDRFGPVNFYAPGNVLVTVLVGNAGYSGIAAAANEPGCDGTVRVSTANMNCAFLTADLTDPTNPTHQLQQSNGQTAFCVMDGLNHSTIHDPAQPGLLDAVSAALEVTDAGFNAYCNTLDIRTNQVLITRQANSDPYYYGYQNTVFFVHDQFNEHVTDYFIEFYDDPTNFFEGLFHQYILQDVHPYSDDNSFRAMLIDTKILGDDLHKPGANPIKISLTAQPEFSVNKKVGYHTFNDTDISAITLTPNEAISLFQANRTLFIDLRIRRDQDGDVYKFLPAPV